MPIGPGCQVDAGIIDEQGNLTPKAKAKFIKDVKDQLTFGSDNLPSVPLFPCGPSIKPIQFASSLDLENEKKFPDFHKNILGSYQKIAQSLNMASDMKLLPICDPIAFGAKLGIKIKIPNFPGGFIPFMIPNPPLLAVKMKLMPPPKLLAKFPGIPAIPPPLPKFDLPPNIKEPDFGTLFDYSLAYSIGIPKFLLAIVAKIPQFALKLPNLPSLFSTMCDTAFSSKLFGDVQPTSTMQIAATKVLTTKVVEMVFISAVGTTLGSASGGIVGGVGKLLGYSPPEDGEEAAQSPRDLIVQYAKDCIDLSWGGGDDVQDQYAQRMLYVEYGGGDPAGSGPHEDPRPIGKQATIARLKNQSSCGLLARACLFAGGASYVFDSKVNTSRQDPSVNLYYDFYKDRYPSNLAISGIIQSAEAKNATIPTIKGDLPPLKKGDIIAVYLPGSSGKEHVMVVYEDYSPGSFDLVTVEGGQIDDGNKDENGKPRPTAIHKKQYVESKKLPANKSPIEPPFSFSVERGSGDVVLNGRKILRLIDGEILCTDTTGADMTRSNGSIPDIANDGNDDRDLVP